MEILTEGESVLIQSLIDKLTRDRRESDKLMAEKERLEKKDQTSQVIIQLCEVWEQIFALNESSDKTRGELEGLMKFTLKNIGMDNLDYNQQIAYFKKLAHV